MHANSCEPVDLIIIALKQKIAPTSVAFSTHFLAFGKQTITTYTMHCLTVPDHYPPFYFTQNTY